MNATSRYSLSENDVSDRWKLGMHTGLQGADQRKTGRLDLKGQLVTDRDSNLYYKESF